MYSCLVSPNPRALTILPSKVTFASLFPLQMCWQGIFVLQSWEISFPLSLSICLLNKPHITSKVIIPGFLDISWFIYPLSLWLHCFPGLTTQKNCRLCLLCLHLPKAKWEFESFSIFLICILSNWPQIFYYFENMSHFLKSIWPNNSTL